MPTKTTIAIIGIVIVIIAIALAYMTTQQAPSQTTTTPATSSPTSTSPTVTETVSSPSSSPASTVTEVTSSPTTTSTSPTTTPQTTTTTPTTTTTTATATTPEQGIEIVVISRHPTDILEKARIEFLKSDYAKKYHITNIKTVVLAAGLWQQYIESGRADVAWGGGPTLFDYLYQQGLLAPLESEEALQALSQIPDEIAGMPMKRVGPDGKIYWVAAAIASFGFTVNHKVLNEYGLPVPKHWADLASPIMGQPLLVIGTPAVGIADPTQSTSNTRMYEIILQRYGWDEGWVILTAMGANAKIYPASGDVRDAVIRGDIAVGITIDFYGYTAMMLNKECEYILPEGETIVNGDPIALVKNSKHPEAAQAFIAWVLTEGQKIWLDPEINRLPANPNVFKTPEGQKRQDLYEAYVKATQSKGMPFNDSLAMSYEFAMQQYFRATIVEVDDYLKAAWKAILNKYFNGELSDDQLKQYMEKMGAPLTFKDPETGETVKFTEDYAIKINQRLISDPAFRSAIIDAWRKAAIDRYNSIVSELGG